MKSTNKATHLPHLSLVNRHTHTHTARYATLGQSTSPQVKATMGNWHYLTLHCPRALTRTTSSLSLSVSPNQKAKAENQLEAKANINQSFEYFWMSFVLQLAQEEACLLGKRREERGTKGSGKLAGNSKCHKQWNRDREWERERQRAQCRNRRQKWSEN